MSGRASTRCGHWSPTKLQDDATWGREEMPSEKGDNPATCSDFVCSVLYLVRYWFTRRSHGHPSHHRRRRRQYSGSMQPLSGTEKTALASISFACLTVLVSSWRNDGEPLYASLAISGLAYAFTYCTIRWTGDVFIKQGFGGEDRSKKHRPRL